MPYLHGAQGTLVRRLEAIFPLVPVSNGRSQPVFTIAGVALPLPSQPKEPAPPLSVPAAQLPKGITVDEDNVACALGHAALLVDRLAGYVGARLPYPLTCAGSRSLVKDPISDIAGPTRLFPLYAKGIEQYRFEYAVYLLNKDVELVSAPRQDFRTQGRPLIASPDPRLASQLMVGRGLRIMDIRHTLPNLMNLLLTISSDLPVCVGVRLAPCSSAFLTHLLLTVRSPPSPPPQARIQSRPAATRPPAVHSLGRGRAAGRVTIDQALPQPVRGRDRVRVRDACRRRRRCQRRRRRRCWRPDAQGARAGVARPLLGPGRRRRHDDADDGRVEGRRVREGQAYPPVAQGHADRAGVCRPGQRRQGARVVGGGARRAAGGPGGGGRVAQGARRYALRRSQCRAGGAL